jgi:hypothetical protein
MIHEVHLAEKIRQRLTDIIVLQMTLLDYALSVPEVSKDSCAAYLDERIRFSGRGQKIAEWLWQSIDRWKPLRDFASFPEQAGEAEQSEERLRKRAWYLRLCKETWALLSEPTIQIEPYLEENAPNWMKRGAAFLEHFYDDFCSTAKFPAYLFSDPSATKFGRQEFLEEFTRVNENLYVCAACDEATYYTVVEGSIRTDIDHYLPKSLYPHFSCHPYNLVPVCKFCNQTSVKGNKDPLAGPTPQDERLSLTDIYLPYRGPGLGGQTYLQIHLIEPDPDGQMTDWIRIGNLILRDTADLVISKHIEALDKIYRIPHRWTQDGRLDKIGETLFRRIRQFVGDGRCMPLGNDTVIAVYNILGDLLYYLYYEDCSKDPFAFAMAWILLALLREEYPLLASDPAPNDEIEPGIARSALFLELIEGLGQSANDHAERTQALYDVLIGAGAE